MRTIDRESPTEEGASGGEHPVSVHRCSSDRVVFVAHDSTDAWIATDTVLDTPE